MVCIQCEGNLGEFGSYGMHWEESRNTLEEMRLENGELRGLALTKVADSLDEFFKKKFNGELGQ